MSFTQFTQVALAQAAGADSAMGTIGGLLPILIMFVVLYFLMIRPQMKRQKEHRAMVQALTKGDEVITAGGLLGKISRVTDNYVAIEVSNEDLKPVEVLCQRTAVTAVLPKGTIKDI